MADVPTTSDTGNRDSPPRTPRWVKVFGIVALVLLFVFVILHLTGRGFRGHGPSRDDAVHQP
jgi:hypothetical protein